MKPPVIISGGTGLIGTYLTQSLMRQGYEVILLSRQLRSLTGANIIRWDPEKQWIDTDALPKNPVIINLAGENLSAKPWTPEQKELISSSRINSLKLIKKMTDGMDRSKIRLISTSAIGYYGTFNSDLIFDENSQPGNDFLAKVCLDWEKAITDIADTGVSTAWIRTGVVLSDKGGALKAIQESMRTGLAFPLGSGRQYIPWIHIRDLISLFEFLLVHSDIQGPFNGVAPAENTNKELTKTIAKVKGKKFIPVGIPGLLLKMILGEMASISLYGSRVSSQKIIEKGFNFTYTDLTSAIESF